ncbi:MAG: FAD-binding protein, partial [Abditibacteriales bacterium]|nr:FAD-binding protein [Abditibacteriales bacterium]
MPTENESLGGCMLDPIVLTKLKDIVGAENVLTSDDERLSYSYDATPQLEFLPEAVVVPSSTEDVAAILRLANEEEFHVVPRGAGTGLSGGSVPVENSIVLLMNRFNRLIEIDTANLTALVEPGVVTAQLHQAVEAQGLFYPPDPGSMKVSTLGGNVAENAGGLRGLKYGVTKDYVMGLEVVLPTGDVLWTGGKCVKDVAGYNLKQVFVGSEGTLGVFTKILLKLIPKPPAKKTLVAYFRTLADAGATVSAIIAAHIIPATMELLDNVTLRCVEAYAKLGLQTDMEAMLLVEVDGHPAAIAEEAEQILSLCQQQGAVTVSLAQDTQEADRLTAARRSAFAALARARHAAILEDATVPRSELVPMLEAIQRIAQKYDVLIGTFGHAGDGNLHPTALIDPLNHAELHRAEQAFEDIFDAAIALGGTITGEHGVGLAKRKFLPRQVSAPGIELMKKLRAVVDPKGVLNPGKVIEGTVRC